MEIEKILSSEVVDLTSLKSFFASDRNMLIEIIRVFVSDTKLKVTQLEENILKLNYEQIIEISQFLKSSYGLMGLSCLNELTVLEKLAGNDKKDNLIIIKLNEIIFNSKESITEYKKILKKLEAA